ncbi:hypothetical protein EJ06DRAFT_534922 [Trichodelitschia bisporula]|uniref:Uncharacterized protein n=1 Tax=Trichodelitschia bisporula TaxID=703511 RepID=A0A6G1HI22_9PEZI|nr:hypothetical protein EJ06DRAFT_534922 [Trichodelitschia bisporula]
MAITAAQVKKDASPCTRTIAYPFWFGGSASCFAACVTHPLDLGAPPLTRSLPLGASPSHLNPLTPHSQSPPPNSTPWHAPQHGANVPAHRRL